MQGQDDEGTATAGLDEHVERLALGDGLEAGVVEHQRLLQVGQQHAIRLLHRIQTPPHGRVRVRSAQRTGVGALCLVCARALLVNILQNHLEQRGIAATRALRLSCPALSLRPLLLRQQLD